LVFMVCIQNGGVPVENKSKTEYFLFCLPF